MVLPDDYPTSVYQLFDLGAHMELVNALRSGDEQVQLNTMGTIRALASAKEESRTVVSNSGDLLPTLQVSVCVCVFSTPCLRCLSPCKLRARELVSPAKHELPALLASIDLALSLPRFSDVNFY